LLSIITILGSEYLLLVYSHWEFHKLPVDCISTH
jgi:hypothetical protein